MLRLASTISILALIVAMPSPVKAQINDGIDALSRMNRVGAEIDRGLAAAEQARLAGQCDSRERNLTRVKKLIEELEGYQSVGHGLGGDPERTREARARAQAILNAPCPPVKESPQPEPAVAVAPPVADREPGQTRTLEDLQIEYAASLCGAEQEAAKQRLLVALRRAIEIERNPAKRDRLLAKRDYVAARPINPCDEAGNPTTGMAGPAPVPAPQADGPPPSILDDMGETAPTRTSLDVLRERLDKTIETCGNRNEFFAAKRALIEEIERRIGIEIDPSKLADLRELHRNYSGKLPSECPPAAPPPPPSVGQIPADGSPLAAVAAVADDRRARIAERAAILLNVYYLASLIPRVGIGVRRDGAPGAAPETDAGRTPRRVNGFGISAGFQTKIAPDFDLRLRGRYEKGDAKTDFSSPATGAQRVDTGIVYGRLSNGSSGIIAGFGGTGSAKVDLEEWGVGAEIGWQIGEPTYFPYAVGLRASVGADYSRSERRHDLSIASSGVSAGTTFSFSQSRLQELEESYAGVSGGLELDLPICEDADLEVYGKGGPFRVNSRFTGTERDMANFGPIGNRDLTLRFDEEDGKWGARFETGAGIRFHLSDALTITGGVRYEYRTDVGSVINPNSGDQVFFGGQTSRLGRQDWQAWDAAVGLHMRF